MLRPTLAVALPAFGLALILSHVDAGQRAAWAGALRSTLGWVGTAAAVPSPRAVALPAAAQPSLPAMANDRNSFTIYANDYGQFETTMLVAGRELPVLVDTGASSVALSYDAAASLGIHPADADFRLRMTTANGVTRAAPTMLSSIRVGNVEARNVPAVVHLPGALATPILLGMTFLNKLGGFEVQSGRLVLKQ